MAVTRKDAFVSLMAIEQAQKAATQRSFDNGIVLLLWGSITLCGLIGFDIFPTVVAGCLLGSVACIASTWQLCYQRSLPVRPRKLKSLRTILLLSSYHISIILGSTLLIGHIFVHQPPYMYTLIGLIDATPLLCKGWSLWHHARTTQPLFLSETVSLFKER